MKTIPYKYLIFNRNRVNKRIDNVSFVPRFTCPAKPILDKTNGEILPSIFLLEIFIPNNDHPFLRKIKKYDSIFFSSSRTNFNLFVKKKKRLSHYLFLDMFAINIKFKKPAIYPKREIVDKLEVGNLIWLVSIYISLIALLNFDRWTIPSRRGYWKIKLSKKKNFIIDSEKLSDPKLLANLYFFKLTRSTPSHCHRHSRWLCALQRHSTRQRHLRACCIRACVRLLIQRYRYRSVGTNVSMLTVASTRRDN